MKNRRKYNVLLINPPSTGSYRSKIMLGDSLGLNAVSGALLDLGCTVEIMDCFLRDFTISNILDKIKLDEQVTIVGITIMWINSVDYVKRIIEDILDVRKDLFVFIGGYAPTFAPKKMLELPVNVVMAGDDLSELSEVLKDFDNWHKRRENNHIAKILNCPLKENAFEYNIINRPDLLEAFEKDRIISLESSKGCYGRCIFCTIFYQYKAHWVPRSVDDIVNEMQYIRNRCDCHVLRFVDANFLGGGKTGWNRCLEIAKEAQRLKFHFIIECRISDINEEFFIKMKKMGLVGVFLGIENSSQQVLDILHKDVEKNAIVQAIEILKKLRITYNYGFMMVTPYTTEDMIYENIELLRIAGYGVRWKLMFSALIVQKEDEFEVKPPVYSFEKNYGYSCINDLCRKILWAYDISLKKYFNVLEAEHFIGMCLERGKQAMDEFYWNLDDEFSNMCIDVFILLLAELKKVDLVYEEILTVLDKYMNILYGNLTNIRKKVTKQGIPLKTKLLTLEEYFC